MSVAGLKSYKVQKTEYRDTNFNTNQQIQSEQKAINK